MAVRPSAARRTRHPPGLAILFLTELWERFSFYGLQAILILYLVLPVADGGAGYTVVDAAAIYANYTMSVYVLSIPGGYIADRLLGLARAVFIGGLIIMTGHIVLAAGTAGSLLIGLSCVALGTSLLKPSVTALVGRLYAPDDPRRDAGFSIYYMGINIGGFIAPLVCGYLAQGETFRAWLAVSGFDARQSWHWGFGAAGVGMFIGLLIFVSAARRFNALHLDREESPLSTRDHASPSSSVQRLSPGYRIACIAFFCASAVIFFAAAKQAGSSLNLFADRFARNEIFGWSFPSSWFQSVYALLVVLLAPVFSMLWLRLGTRQPSGPAKAVAGLLAASVAFVIMKMAADAAAVSPVSPLWLLAVYFFLTIGELCISPVGLSNVTRLAPPRRAGLMMGLWFLAIALGAKLAGVFAAWSSDGAPADLSSGFAFQALFIAVACLALSTFVPRLRRGS